MVDKLSLPASNWDVMSLRNPAIIQRPCLPPLLGLRTLRLVPCGPLGQQSPEAPPCPPPQPYLMEIDDRWQSGQPASVHRLCFSQPDADASMAVGCAASQPSSVRLSGYMRPEGPWQLPEQPQWCFTSSAGASPSPPSQSATGPRVRRLHSRASVRAQQGGGDEDDHDYGPDTEPSVVTSLP